MPVSEPDHPSQSLARPGDFARILLASSGSPPRARARDQQADIAGEALRQRVLNRLIMLDPDPDELEAALLAIVNEFDEPAGPTRGVCTAILQEWEMTRIQPGYWAFLISQALQTERKPSRSRSQRADEPGGDA